MQTNSLTSTIDPALKYDRFLMFLPGFLTWLMLLMPLWLGFVAPQAASFVLTFLSVYWLYMATSRTIGLYKGYKKYKEETAVKWYEECKKLDFAKLPEPESRPEKLSGLKHLLIIPTVSENIEILGPTFQSIINSSYPKDKIIIAVGTEEKGADDVRQALIELKRMYKDALPEIMHFIHPAGITGEIVGVASPNRTWAAKHAVEELKRRGENIKDYVFTTFDSDTIIHPEFLARIAYLYLTDEKRLHNFYETCVRLFDNNYWKVPVISRVEASNITFGVLSRKQNDDLPEESFSCYSAALDTLVAANYWDVTLIDDTVFFWRAMIARNGNFSHKYFYLPVSGDATDGINYLKAHKNLFRQLVRWGWGSVTSVIALKIIFSNKLKEVSLEKKMLWLFFKLERHLFLRTVVFLITFGFFFLTLVNVQFKNTATIYGLPQIISIFLSAGMIMLLPLAILRQKLYPLPKDASLIKRIVAFFEGLLIIIDLLTYSFIPWLYAETMMMFGKLPKVTFYTPKQR